MMAKMLGIIIPDICKLLSARTKMLKAKYTADMENQRAEKDADTPGA